MTVKIGSIINYDHPGNSSVGAGETCPMIVVAVAKDTVSGTVFLPNGHTEYVATDNPDKPQAADTQPATYTQPATDTQPVADTQPATDTDTKDEGQ